MTKFWLSKLLLLASVAACAAVTPHAFARPAGSSHNARHSARGKQTATSPADEVKNIFWQPDSLQQGSVAFFTVEFNSAPVRVSATWVGKNLSFFRTDDPKIWYALAGDDLETKPGSYELDLTAVLRSGKAVRSTKKVDVGATVFKTGTVDVPENFVEPDDAGKRQIAHDEALKSKAYAHSLAAPQWSGSFVPPVNGRPTDTFGESRLLNEERTSTHRGTDFPVPEGTPVVVSNSGTVVLANNLFYEGGCVIVDHGQQFFTIYMHLSRIDVAVGDKVAKGARLGLSGKTGRVTGPHLHMGVRWEGAYLDPTKLLALTLPKVGNGPDEHPGSRGAHRASTRR